MKKAMFSEIMSGNVARRETLKYLAGGGVALAAYSSGSAYGQGDEPRFAEEGPSENYVPEGAIVWMDSVFAESASPARPIKLEDGQLVISQGSLFQWRDSDFVPLGSSINAKAFGAQGDGVTDDGAAIEEALTIAAQYRKPVYFPAGTYLSSRRLTVEAGAYGDGSEHTIIQAINNGEAQYNFFFIRGSGLYEGLTIDGGVSEDPEQWTEVSYDAFTGWGALGIVGSDIIVRNCVARNSWRAGVRCELSKNIILDNVTVKRSRGNFGDGMYIVRCDKVQMTNCRAYDYTRIGFVCEGGVSREGNERATLNVMFTACSAEYGHDQSVNYGGREFNAGFWFERASQISCIDCIAVDQEETGFRCYGSSSILSDDVGRATVQFTFTNCYAKNTRMGYRASGVGKAALGHAMFSGCVSDGNRQGFLCYRITATISNCSYFFSGGDQQSRAVATGMSSTVIIEDFFEMWQNKPEEVFDPETDAASVSTFSSNSPREVHIRRYKTYDGSPAVMKYRVPASGEPILFSIEDTHFIASKLRARCSFTNCRVRVVHQVDSIKAEGCQFLGFSGYVHELSANNCRFTREEESDWLLNIYSLHASPEPFFWIANSHFIGNLETGGEFVRVDSSPETADVLRAHDVYLSGCMFYNSGGGTDRACIVLPRSSGLHVTGAWQSASIERLTAFDGQIAGMVHTLD